MENPGKLDRKFFTESILRYTGYRRPEDKVPPKNGVDTGIISIGNGKVMAVTTDPFYFDPVFGYEDSAWFAYHILASDITTAGVYPEYMTVDLNLPISISNEEIARMWKTVHEEAYKYKTSIITGHTARYANTGFPMVGGATMFGFTDDDKYVTTAMARPGDIMIMTKTAGIEAASLLTRIFPNHVKKNLGEDKYRYGFELFRKLSTVDEAIQAIEFGTRKAITSMHDATEGGLLGAVYEVAEASGNGVSIDKEAIHVDDYVKEIHSLFGIDPLRSISEGTLLMTIDPEYADEFMKRLTKSGIDSYVIGKMTTKDEGIKFKDGSEPIGEPEKDPFWYAVEKSMKMGLS
ncbi:AIR synthase family protein [Thermoplasma volcanium]|uniref:AIR synthase family protein n=1 Tax=Thermoplasma volcanium TaxID=50339 RepID=UPI001389A874|nr:AIR synthase-related protein [Thermoplasma volcanium]